MFENQMCANLKANRRKMLVGSMRLGFVMLCGISVSNVSAQPSPYHNYITTIECSSSSEANLYSTSFLPFYISVPGVANFTGGLEGTSVLSATMNAVASSSRGFANIRTNTVQSSVGSALRYRLKFTWGGGGTPPSVKPASVQLLSAFACTALATMGGYATDPLPRASAAGSIGFGDLSLFTAFHSVSQGEYFLLQENINGFLVPVKMSSSVGSMTKYSRIQVNSLGNGNGVLVTDWLVVQANGASNIAGIPAMASVATSMITAQISSAFSSLPPDTFPASSPGGGTGGGAVSGG